MIMALSVWRAGETYPLLRSPCLPRSMALPPVPRLHLPLPRPPPRPLPPPTDLLLFPLPAPLPQRPLPLPVLGPSPLGPVPFSPGMLYLLICDYPKRPFLRVPRKRIKTFLWSAASADGVPADHRIPVDMISSFRALMPSAVATPFRPASAFFLPGQRRIRVNQGVVAALDSDGPTVGKGAGDQASCLGQDSAQGGGRDFHQPCGRLTTDPFGIHQSQCLHSLQWQSDSLQAVQGYPPWLVQSCLRQLPDTAGFSRSRHC